MSFGHKHYVPILLTKRGERSGLADVQAVDKANMTPLFLVSPVDWNFDTEEPSKTVDAHLAALGKELATCWGSAEAFLDTQFVDDAARMASGEHPLLWLIGQANAHGANLLPTVSPTRDAAYVQAAADCIARDKRGACIRLSSDEWTSTSSTGTAALNALTSQLGIGPTEVDLVLDLAEDVTGSAALVLTAARGELSTLPYLQDWRSLTLAGTGFPKQLSSVPKGLSTIERVEWTLHQAILAGSPARKPSFGDYAIAHPDPVVDVNPRMLNISASLRYTIDGEWLIAKGNLFKGNGGSGLGGAAMLPLAAALCADSRFASAAHCAGDAWIATVAAGGGTGGSPEVWRKVGTTHHLTHVAQAVANLP